MKCCGEDRQTPFCPMCGKKANSNPLVELLAHVTKQAEHNRNLAARRAEKSRDESRPQDREWFAKKAAQLTAVADKWQRWADALKDVLAFSRNSPEDTVRGEGV